MTIDPTPFDRLIRLEKLVSDLQLRAGPQHPPSPIEHSLLERHQWPADELLLTRLVRRSPEALKAYEAPAELTQTDSQGVLLKASSGSSPFRLCELQNGDAVVWLSAEHENWIYDTDIFRCLFHAPSFSIFSSASLILVRSSVSSFFNPMPYCSSENGLPTILKAPGDCAA